MFKISTAIVGRSPSPSSAGIKLLIPPVQYAAMAQIPNFEINPAAIDTAGIAISQGIATVPVSSQFDAEQLTIAGLTYQFTLDPTPAAGYFAIVNGELVVGLLNPTIVPQLIAYYPYSPPIPTDCIPAPFPEIATEFPINGQISWTLTWEEQPTATVNFITLASERDQVIAYFGTNRRIYIYGVGFAPSGQFSITDISRSKSVVPLIEVSANLTGYHARYLDFYTTVGKQLFLPDCTAPPSGQLNSPDTMSVQTLASQVGTSLVGGSIYVDPQILTSPATATSLGAQLQPDVVRVAGAFIDYNNAASIAIVNYEGGASHTIREPDIRSDVSSSVNNRLNGNGSLGFYKTYDPLTKVTFGSRTTAPQNTKSPKPTWQPRQPVSTKTIEGDSRPELNPYDGIQRDLSIVFDISGIKKRRKDINLIDGNPVYEQEQEWGWVAMMKDDAIFSGETLVRIAGQWRKIMSKDTYYTYNDDGYLTNVSSKGFILSRLRTENPQKPESLAVRINATNPDPKEVANLATFRFEEIPTTGSEVYELAPFSEYYSDITAPRVQWSICLPDGQPTEISLVDKSWIPPYFVRKKTVREQGKIIRENPLSTALKPLPPLTSGKDSLFVETISIEPRPVLTLSILDKPKDPTFYSRTVDDRSSSGAQFNNNLSISKSETINGRPPIAPNRGATLELVQPPNRSGAAPDLKPFAISSGLSGENTGYVTVGTLSYPTAQSEQQALRAAQVDIDLINSKNTLQETMTVNWRPEIRPGDFVTYSVNNQSRRRRVIAVTQTISIRGMVEGQRLVTSIGTQLKLGIDARTPIKVSSLPERSSVINL